MIPTSRIPYLILVLLLTRMVYSAPNTPRKHIIVGEDEYNRTGKYPLEISISRRGDSAIIPTFDKGKHKLHLRGSGSPKGNYFEALDAVYPGVFPLDSALLNQISRMRTFHFNNGNMMPLHGELYRFEFKADGVTLKRISKNTLGRIAPQSISRIIPIVEAEPRVFWNIKSKQGTHYFDNHLSFFKIVNLTIDSTGEAAKFILVPHEKPHRKPISPEGNTCFEYEVRIGELIEANNKSYRVLNIVPYKKIEGTNFMPVGWIEISANPVVPTENDKLAIIKKLDISPYLPVLDPPPGK